MSLSSADHSIVNIGRKDANLPQASSTNTESSWTATMAAEDYTGADRVRAGKQVLHHMSTPRFRHIDIHPDAFDTLPNVHALIDATARACLENDSVIDVGSLALYVGYLKSCSGQYTHGTREIEIMVADGTASYSFLPTTSAYTFFHTLAHELRHCAQHVRGESPEDYLMADETDYETYTEQPHEVDADDFAEEIADFLEGEE